MSAKTKYQVGTAILYLAILVLLVQILGMTNVIPKYMPTRNVSVVSMVLVIAAASLRRRGRAEMASPPSTPV